METTRIINCQVSDQVTVNKRTVRNPWVLKIPNEN